MPNYILSIDQGTTSSRAILFTTDGEIAHVSQEEFRQYYPHDGWVEHIPAEIWQSVQNTSKDVMGKLNQEDTVVAIGITNQRETTLLWDKTNGKPIYNAIVWQDRRTADFCDELKRAGLEQAVREKTGLVLDPYFSASKLRWILNNVDGARSLAEQGKLAFGTVDSYLIWQFTGGAQHLTDITNASRTSLFNIHKKQWDEDLLEIFDIPRSLLPEVKECADNFGTATAECFGRSIPVLGVAGDQQAALIGQACFMPGDTKSTYGTGCFLVTNTGENALISKNRLLTTVAYSISGTTHYAIEGSIFIAGAAIQWLRDRLEFFEAAQESEALAKMAGYQEHLIVVPAFTGLGAPYWDPEARGAILGLTRDSGIPQIVAATLQSIGYQTRDLQEALAKDGHSLSELRVDGGLSANNWAMQFLADILNISVDRSKNIETTALGAAYLAGLKAGLFGSPTQLDSLRTSDKVFEPGLAQSTNKALYENWQKAVSSVRT